MTVELPEQQKFNKTFTSMFKESSEMINKRTKEM